MATIRKRGEAQWEARVRRHPHPTRSKTFETKKEAEQWARQVESEMDRGAYLSCVEAEKTTLAATLDRYEREVLPTKKSQATVRSQIKLLKSVMGSYPLATITSSMLAEFRDDRLEEVAPDTVRKDLSLISRILNTAIKDWGIALPHGNPVTQVRMPKPSESRDRRLLVGEEELLLAAAREYEQSRADAGPMVCIITFAIETAMRRSEIAKMRWSHLKKKRVLLVPDTKIDGKDRPVPLSLRALAVLDTLARSTLTDTEENDLLGERVWEMRADSITQAFERIVKRGRAAYIEKCEQERRMPDPDLLVDLRFHDLRHEATSRLFERGLPQMEVAAITGHSDLKMLKRYTHLRPESLALKLG